MLGIVQQHRGGIGVESAQDKGTTFSIYLPELESGQVVEQKPRTSELPRGEGTILLAEDEEHVLRLTGRVLQAAGYRVLKAADGGEALAVYEQHAGEIDVLLLDVIMPHLGGPAVLKEIRARGGATPCIFASGYSETDVHEDFVVSEGVNLLQKPYTPQELIERIRDVMSKSTRKTTET
ncbi:MAG: response regulator [Candidatus Hydrogenedens sp.]|nr:response regulator [Candidatus Hydrogenedens sp.]